MSDENIYERQKREKLEKYIQTFQALLDKNPDNPVLDHFSLSDAQELTVRYDAGIWSGHVPPHASPEHFFRTCSMRTYELEEAITEGPVLSLNIDGVLSLGEMNGRHSNRPNGFYRYTAGVQDRTVVWHPRLLDWLGELNDTYAQIAWNSSWFNVSGQMGACIGAEFAENWGLLSSKPEVPGRERFSEKTLRGYCGVALDVPLAMVDDQFLGDPSVRDLISARSAPTLVLIPNPAIGLGRTAVDLLLEFATDPWQEKFSASEPLLIYASKKLRWADGWPEKDKVEDEPEGWTGSKKQLRPDEQSVMYELANTIGHSRYLKYYCGKGVVEDSNLLELLDRAGIAVREGKSVTAASPDQPECVKFRRMLKYHRFVERWFRR